MKIAFGTVAYDLAYDYHDDFVSSINQQDYSDFDLILINDNLSKSKYNNLVNKIDSNVVEVFTEGKLSIAENRIKLLEVAKNNGYDLLILGDFDDVMSNDRVSMIVSNFDKEYGFFYNDLCYLESKKDFFDSLPKSIDEIDYIYECNFLGLSNTSINLGRINQDILDSLHEKQTVAFDWIIFSVFLLNGLRGKKVDKCKTFYRIHDQNTAGETQVSIDGLRKEISIKLSHYSKLKDLDDSYIYLEKFYKSLDNEFEEVSSLLMGKYTYNNNYWWSMINSKYFEERNI